MAADAQVDPPALVRPHPGVLARLRPGGYGLRWLRHDGRDVRGAVRRAVLHRRAEGYRRRGPATARLSRVPVNAATGAHQRRASDTATEVPAPPRVAS